jgi:outer membrane receptor protein involved in Fe transport
MKSLIILLSFFCLINVKSQDNLKSPIPITPKIGILTGIIQDSITKKPIDYASVRLLSMVDSSAVGQIYSDEKGVFKLELIPTGKYFVKITFFGYSNEIIKDVIFSNEIPGRDLGIIKMNPEKSTSLDQVDIVAKQELMTSGLDKKVYNVGEDLSVKGGTVNDILNNIPSIEVDNEGKVSLRGDGNVTILIDGRPSSLTGGNGKSMLDALPAGSIERIEIVNNPSAKYDPDGTSGIINIVLKKNKLRGINGNVLISGSTGTSFNGTASLSVRNAKMNVFGTYAYRYYSGDRNRFGYFLNNLGSDSVYKLNQDRLGTDLSNTNTARFGADFYLKPRHTLGFTLTGNFDKRERTGTVVNTQTLNTQTPIREWERASSDPISSQNADLNLNYKFDFKEDKGFFTADVTQSTGRNNANGYYDESYLTENGLPIVYQDLLQQLESNDKNRVTTIQSDFTRILGKGMKIESGVKAIIRQATVKTFSETFDYSSNTYLADTLSNFSYQYDEQVISAYGNFSQQFKKFRYQGGLRIEEAMQAPNLISQNQSFKNTYFNVFPSGYVKYTVSKAIELSLGYSKRINRPTGENLNPFSNYSDPYNLMRGNPALRPEYINSFDFGMTYVLKKVNFSGNVYFRQTSNVIQRVKLFYEDGTSAATFANIDQSQNLGAELTFTYRPTSWMRNIFSLNGNKIQYTDNTTGIDWNNSGFNWSVKYAGTFDFWKKTASIQVNARYNSPIFTAQGKAEPRASVDLSGEKNLKGGKWAVGFRLADVFDTQEFRFEVEQNSNFQTARFKQNTRRFYLNVSYKFGKYEVSKKSKITPENGGGGDF